jgi:hypothetical protein
MVLASFSDASPSNLVDGRPAAINLTTSESFFRGLIYAPNGTILVGGDRNFVEGAPFSAIRY